MPMDPLVMLSRRGRPPFAPCRAPARGLAASRALFALVCALFVAVACDPASPGVDDAPSVEPRAAERPGPAPLPPAADVPDEAPRNVPEPPRVDDPPATVAPDAVPAAAVVPTPGAPASFADLVERVRPAVVNIYTTQVQRVRREPRYYHPYLPPGYRGTEERIAQSLGSGFLVDESGHILTNSHVIEGATQIRVKLHDDRELDAELVGVDPLTDIALVRVAPFAGMRSLPLGDSDTLRVGDWVMAVGNPFGLTSTVTAGILSARGRRDVPLGGRIRFIDFLQTDASINPGNSGGPLVNMQGEVVGINTAVNREGQGIGFAIPSSMARDVYLQLRDAGRVQRSWLGVYVDDISEEMARVRRLPRRDGAIVSRVVPGGPAALGGLRPGDVITRFDTTDVATSDALRWAASNAGVGRRVPVQILRDGQELQLEVTLGELPE